MKNKLDKSDARFDTKLSRIDIHFTSKGRQVAILHLESSVQVLPLPQEEEWLRSKRFVGKVKRVEPPTNVTNTYDYAFSNGKGIVDKYWVEIIIEDNFEPVKDTQVGDRLIYRFSPTQEPLYAARVTEISDGKVSKVRGQMRSGGSIFEHHPDLLKEQIPCNWELLRPREGASLKSWTELFVPGKDYVTSKGRFIKVFHSIKNMPVTPLDLEEQRLGTFASRMIRIEEPNPAYNCFGHGLLDKKGMIQNVDDILEDDFSLVTIPQKGDRLVGRDFVTGQAIHMAIILKIPDGKVSLVHSKENALYLCNFDTLKEGYNGLNWEVYRKNPLVEDYEVSLRQF